MLGFMPLSRHHAISSIPITNQILNQERISKHTAQFLSIRVNFANSQLKSKRKNPRRVVPFAENKDVSKESNGFSNNGGGGEEGDLKKDSEGGGGGGDERPRFNLRWSELLLDPDPDNVVAVGLTGVLAWASVQVLWQLFVISFAILVAAVKYSFIAALLIFILITLL